MPARCDFEGGGCMQKMTASVPEIFGGVGKFPVVTFKDVGEGVIKNSDMKDVTVCCNSDESSSSSLGKNSDVSECSLEKSEGCEEVESAYKGPLNAMDALEQVLPIRRGISKFYNGKSKSYTSLGDASAACSVEEIAKASNAYTRRRRNLLACSLTWDKTQTSRLRGNVIGGAITKKGSYNSSRTSFALAVAMRNSEADKPVDKEAHFPASPWRSFSFADLQRCSATSDQSSTKHA